MCFLAHDLDEYDLKRRHITHVIGSWMKANPTKTVPPIIQRFLQSDTSREALEADLQRELNDAKPILEAELRHALSSGNQDEIQLCRTRLSKANYEPKSVYSAMINVPNDDSWPRAIGGRVEA